MTQNDIFTIIKNAAALCADCELNRLKLEENMLTELIRKQGVANKFRKEAIERLHEINERQIFLLGGN